MFRRLKGIRPFAESCSFLWRNFSGNSRKKPKFVKRPPLNPKSNLFNWPTLQRFPAENERVVDDKDEKPYSTFKVDSNRVQEMWQKARIGAKEQVVLVEREPAKQATNPKEYSPVRSSESSKPGSWTSATVLAATGKIQHHRYMRTPPKMTTNSYQTENQSEIPYRPENSASGSKSEQFKTSNLQELAKSVAELHRFRAEEMDKMRTREEYSKESACLKLCDLSALGKIRFSH
ncbi:uncharacterized protein hydra [Drosophila takahashii]|uniref:uncharacterized protein hydra n=1 Tax=Drosophila takahashii TaxID=29030 RepID=UPI001CF8328F|nr:uncharacterized protein LOC108056763 [Drosophila takahashii]